MMGNFAGEFLGTMILVLLGNGVVANVLLNKTKGNNSGWIVITTGWAFAVFVGVIVAAHFGAGHLNPAVTIGLAVGGLFPWSSVIPFIIAQMLGASLGATLVWMHYKQHIDITEDNSLIAATFFTSPAIKDKSHNFFSEMLGTFILVFAVFYMVSPSEIGSISASSVAFVVWAIGLALGGTTGYAINPARDLAPRIIHHILPINNKASSDWDYSIIPVVGPVAGAIIAALIYRIF